MQAYADEIEAFVVAAVPRRGLRTHHHVLFLSYTGVPQIAIPGNCLPLLSFES